MNRTKLPRYGNHPGFCAVIVGTAFMIARNSMDVVADGSTLVISGQLDVRSIADLRARLYDHLSEHHEAVVLDLSGVESADLSALRMLAVASRLANNAGHRLSVRGCPDAVRRLLHLTHLRGLMIVESESSSFIA